MLSVDFSLSAYSNPGNASEYIFIPASLMCIKPARTLPAHILLLVISRGDCVFVSRSPKPARVVDADKCIACGKCIQSGCPSVVLSDEKHPKTGKRKARIEPVTCVGCGICAQICPVHAISGPEQA